MANEIEQATQRVRGNGEKLHGTGKAGYQAAPIEAPRAKPRPDWGGLISSAANLYGAYEKATDDRAAKRAEQIINELTPAERSAAFENGTLLYKDDKKAMSKLRTMVGQQEAQTLDISTQRLITDGVLKSRKEVDEYRARFYNEQLGEIAKGLGVSDTDSDLLTGFNNNSARRQVAMYETFDQVESERLKAISLENANKQVSQLVSDTQFLSDPRNAAGLRDVLQSKFDDREYPTARVARKGIMDAISEVSTQPHSTEFLMNFGEQVVTLDGGPITVREMMGAAQWSNAVKTSEVNTLANNKALKSQFVKNFTVANNFAAIGDYESANLTLDVLNDSLATTFPSNFSNPYQDQIDNLRASVSLAQHKALAQQQEALIDEEYRAMDAEKIKEAVGEAIATGVGTTDYRLMQLYDTAAGAETNKQAFEDMFTEVDEMVANRQMTEEQGAARRMQIAAITDEDSHARSLYKATTDRGLREINAAVRMTPKDIDEAIEKGEDPFKSLKAVQLAFNENRAMFTNLAPELAGDLAAVEALNTYGVDGLTTLIGSKRAMLDIDPIRRDQMRQGWDAQLLASPYATLAQGDAAFAKVGYTIYQASLNSGSNTTEAGENALRYMAENTSDVNPSGDSKRRATIGKLPNSILMLDPQDANSRHAGIKEVNRLTDDLYTRFPEIPDGNWAVGISQNGKSITWTNKLNPQQRMHYSVDAMRANYKISAQIAAENAKAAAEEDLWNFRTNKGGYMEGVAKQERLKREAKQAERAARVEAFMGKKEAYEQRKAESRANK